MSKQSTPLTQAEKKTLRGMAQRLKSCLSIGRHGLTPSVLREIDTALRKNGLIKIRIEAERDQIPLVSGGICSELDCEQVGSVGKTVVLFREMPEEESV
jgi:putative YhbY family RNA-binding protein